MFEMWYWSSIIESVRKLPKEVIIGAAAGYVVMDVHKRNCEVKVAVAEAEARKAEADLEALKIKTFAVES